MRIQKNDLKILFKKKDYFKNFLPFIFLQQKKIFNLKFKLAYMHMQILQQNYKKKYAFFYSCSSSDQKVTYLYIYKKILVFFD